MFCKVVSLWAKIVENKEGNVKRLMFEDKKYAQVTVKSKSFLNCTRRCIQEGVFIIMKRVNVSHEKAYPNYERR